MTQLYTLAAAGQRVTSPTCQRGKRPFGDYVPVPRWCVGLVNSRPGGPIGNSPVRQDREPRPSQTQFGAPPGRHEWWRFSVSPRRRSITRFKNSQAAVGATRSMFVETVSRSKVAVGNPEKSKQPWVDQFPARRITADSARIQPAPFCNIPSFPRSGEGLSRNPAAGERPRNGTRFHAGRRPRGGELDRQRWPGEWGVRRESRTERARDGAREGWRGEKERRHVDPG